MPAPVECVHHARNLQPGLAFITNITGGTCGKYTRISCLVQKDSPAIGDTSPSNYGKCGATYSLPRSREQVSIAGWRS